MKKKNIIIIILLVLCAVMIVATYSYYKKISYDKYQLEHQRNSKLYITRKKYKANEYVTIGINNNSMGEIYFQNYISIMEENPLKAYDLLSKESKSKYTQESFIVFATQFIKNQNNLVIDKQAYLYGKTTENYDIITASGYKFTFIANGIMVYKVEISMEG